jgi:6-phosphofructokinase 1
VPKTIDNDIGIIDRSFGFDTAVEEAEKAIASAAVESRCTPNGIGIVKVMGRSSGFLAAHSALASRGVDLVLIPEVAFELDGKNGILPHIARALKRNGHCLIVLAEGAGTHLLPATAGTDPSGNKILPDNGAFLKQAINAYFKAQRVEVKIAYNDPSYMIRSVPANSADQVYCIILAQNAVHGAMAGYTGFTSALVNNRTCYLPVELIVQSSPTYLNPHGRTWERVFSSTHQPNPVRVSKL